MPQRGKGMKPRVAASHHGRRSGIPALHRGRGRYRYRNRSPIAPADRMPQRGYGIEPRVAASTPLPWVVGTSTFARAAASSPFVGVGVGIGIGIDPQPALGTRTPASDVTPTPTPTPTTGAPGHQGPAPLRRLSCAPAVQDAPTGQRNKAQGFGGHAATLGWTSPLNPNPNGVAASDCSRRRVPQPQGLTRDGVRSSR
jgi:hypothetical protein